MNNAIDDQINFIAKMRDKSTWHDTAYGMFTRILESLNDSKYNIDLRVRNESLEKQCDKLTIEVENWKQVAKDLAKATL